jgi:hypothetical protein
MSHCHAILSLHAQLTAAAGFYQEFFDDKFDASRYANSIIQGTSIANCLQKVRPMSLTL